MKSTKAAGTPNLTRPAFVCQDGFRSTWRHSYYISSYFSRKSCLCQGEAYTDFGATCLVPRWSAELCLVKSATWRMWMSIYAKLKINQNGRNRCEEQELPLRWWHFEVVPKMPSPEALAAARRLQGHVIEVGTLVHMIAMLIAMTALEAHQILLETKTTWHPWKIPDCPFARPKLIVWEVAQWIDLHGRLQPSCSSPH